MPDALRLRLATMDDAPRLRELIALSVRGLMTAEYSSPQLESALGTWLGPDTRLIEDGTYFVVETIDLAVQHEHREKTGRSNISEALLVACGGWSKRHTPYGSDHRAGRDDALLDPAREPARIRAFFVHPDWARRGLGRMLLEASEAAARNAGFTHAILGATLTGVPLYERCGYAAQQRVDLPLASGDALAIVEMTKQL